jgi:uncharacterized membrane protein YhaH (DUF805 family)
MDRRTFWLHYFLPLEIISLLPLIWSPPESYGPWATVDFFLIQLLILVPSISSQVTRLHDRGHSAWWLLWGLVPGIGQIVLIVQFCMKGEAGPNGYGPPSPRYPLPGGPFPALIP